MKISENKPRKPEKHFKKQQSFLLALQNGNGAWLGGEIGGWMG